MPRITKNKQKSNKKETVSFIIVKKTRKTRKTQKGGTDKLSTRIYDLLTQMSKTNRNVWIVTKKLTDTEQVTIDDTKAKIKVHTEDEIDVNGKKYDIVVGKMKQKDLKTAKAELTKNIPEVKYHRFDYTVNPSEKEIEDFITGQAPPEPPAPPFP